MSFGDKIKQFRFNSNLSQEILAERLNVSRQSISKWENDKVLPDTDKLIQIAAIFGVSIDDMLFEEINQSNTSQKTLTRDIWEAAKTNDIESIRYNLDKGIYVDEPAKNEDAATPLMIAVTFNQYKAAEFLIRNGANVNLQKTDGATPIYLAVFFGRVEIVQLLMNYNANPHIKSKDNLSAVDLVDIEWSNKHDYLYQFFDQKYSIGIDINKIKESRPIISSILQK